MFHEQCEMTGNYRSVPLLLDYLSLLDLSYIRRDVYVQVYLYISVISLYTSRHYTAELTQIHQRRNV